MSTLGYIAGALFLVSLMLPIHVAAESEDDLFGGDMIEEDDTADSKDVLPGHEFTVFDDIEWGGTLDSRFGITHDWRGDTYPELSDLFDSGVTKIDFDLSASLYFDARPSAAYRVFGKIGMEYPFSADEDGDLYIEELYTDVQVLSNLFIRAGVFNAGWGTGYFFSPADVLSTTTIDPENPETDANGPTAVRFLYVAGTTSVTFYILYQDTDDPLYLAYAQTLEFLVKNAEIGLGSRFMPNHPTSLILTISLPANTVDFFGELKGSYESDTVYLVETENPLLDPIGFSTAVRDEQTYIDATIGLIYTRSDPNLRVAVQYLYSSADYVDYTLPSRALDALSSDDPAVIGALSLLDPVPGVDDLAGYGRHAGATSAAWNRIGDSILDLSVFALLDIGDMSGYVRSTLTLEPADGFKPYLDAMFFFGDGGSGRYTQEGTGWSVGVGARFGAGAF